MDLDLKKLEAATDIQQYLRENIRIRDQIHHEDHGYGYVVGIDANQLHVMFDDGHSPVVLVENCTVIPTTEAMVEFEISLHSKKMEYCNDYDIFIYEMYEGWWISNETGRCKSFRDMVFHFIMEFSLYSEWDGVRWVSKREKESR